MLHDVPLNYENHAALPVLNHKKRSLVQLCTHGYHQSAQPRALEYTCERQCTILCAAGIVRMLTASSTLQVELLMRMLNLEPWRRYPLNVQMLSSEFSHMLAGAPVLQDLKQHRAAKWQQAADAHATGHAR